MSDYVSPFGNAADNFLYDAMYAGKQQQQQNQLMKDQQDISGHEIEMGARLANTILDPTLYPTPEARAAAFPSLVANARAQFPGYFKNAPSVYPGDEATRALARMGTPSQTQAEWQFNLAANKAYTDRTTPTASAPATGGGTGSAAPAVPAYGGGAGNVPVPPEYMPYFQEASQRTGIPVDLLIAQARQESGFNPGATGGAGEVGIMQIHPKTAGSPGFGLTGVQNPDVLRDPRTNINFGADYLAARAKAANADLTTPAGQAAALRAYNGGGDPNYVANVFRYMPAGGPAVATARAPGSTATAAGQPVITGDSLASPAGLGGSGVKNLSSAAVLANVRADSRAGKYDGKPVVLSTGASNDFGSDLNSVEQQIREAQAGNAGKITVLGVGPAVEAKAPGTNAKLQALSKAYGADFVPLPADQMSPDGVHPTAQGYATLKAAIAPAQGAPYRVASNAPTPPPASTAPASGQPQAQAQVPQPPANRAMPGSADGPPAPPPPAPSAPAGAPQPPQLAPVNARGLTPPQQAAIDAMTADPRVSVQQRIEREQGFQNLNIQLQQKQFSDWIQLQQLQTSQGQLGVSQGELAIKYQQYMHPDAKVTLSGGEIITQDPRDGHEIAPRIKVTPNEAPRSVDGTAVEENGQWRQPKPGEQGVPGKWTVGPAGGQFFPEATAPAQAGYEANKTAYNRNSGQISGIADKGEAAQADQVRIKEMQDQLDRIVTGPGTATKVQMAAWLERWLPNQLNPFNQQTQGLTDAGAAEVFNKLAFRNATTQERSVAGSRGAGSRMTEMFLQSNPGLDLLTDANRRMLNVMRIANQADIDKTQGAQDHFVKNEQAFRDSNGKTYTSLESYNADWQRQRNPEVFAAAASAAAGLPARDGEVNGVKFNGWANELNDAEERRVLEIVGRAAPGSRVNTKGGDIIVRPQTPARPPIPPGFAVVR